LPFSSRKRQGEAAWITVAREELPGHLTWPGFCRSMSWANSVPFKLRCSDNMKFGYYLKMAQILDMAPIVFINKVICEMESRKTLNMEVEYGEAGTQAARQEPFVRRAYR
jgi:hypothetical protein